MISSRSRIFPFWAFGSGVHPWSARIRNHAWALRAPNGSRGLHSGCTWCRFCRGVPVLLCWVYVFPGSLDSHVPAAKRLHDRALGDFVARQPDLTRRSSEFGPALDRARLRSRPGSIDARVALGTIPLRFPGSGLGIAVALDERVFKEQWNTVRHCEEIVKRLLRFPWQQAGIAVALDERDCKEQWNTVRHCEEIVRRLLSRRPGNVLDREAYGAKVLAIVAALIPINLSEGIDLDTLHDVLSAAMSQEKTGVDDFDDVAVAAEQLHGAGELQGIEYRFGNTANLARKAGHKSSLDL